MAYERIAACAPLLAGCLLGAAAAERPPNILFILADDLGYGDLGCYGQRLIRTPHIDLLAREGLRFTRFYSGSTVSAPSRCSLLTGLHMGHACIRDNAEVGTWDSYQGQMPLPAGTATIATLLQKAGYATACIGKWGLGGVGTSGDPLAQGFERFFGFNCQRQAHNYYPSYLTRDRQRVVLEGNDGRSPSGAQYAPDLMAEEAMAFIDANRERPFFLYFASPIPHVALQVPEDSLAEYRGRLEDRPYDGRQGYLPHPTPHAAYAAMITRLDRDVGRLLARLRELKLEDRTLVMFSSDNGPTFNGGSDTPFFNSNAGMRGGKCDLYEAGIRMPLIARWPRRIAAGSVSDHLSAFWDILPTAAELAGVAVPAGSDGISMLPTLLGSGTQRSHDHLYWEYHGQQALRQGDWKVVRPVVRGVAGPLQLFDLASDPHEATDLASRHPEIIARLEALMRTAHVPCPAFPLPDER